MRTSIIWLALALLAAVPIGCKKTAEHSGFLGDYSSLEPDARLDGAISYFVPGALARYDRFLIDPVVVHFAPNAEGTSLDPAKLAELAEYGHDQLVEGLSKSYEVVTMPGPGVLRMRVAITDIKKSKAAWNILPQTKVMGVGLGGASIEAEAVDSVTGRRVAALVDSRPGARFSLAGLGAMDHAKEVIRLWIKDFVERIDAAHAG